MLYVKATLVGLAAMLVVYTLFVALWSVRLGSAISGGNAMLLPSPVFLTVASLAFAAGFYLVTR